MLKILIIDDNEDDQSAFKRYIMEHMGPNVTVIPKFNGYDGLQYLETESPDCIILDYGLPDMNGLEFIKKIEKYNKKGVAIIMLTGQGNEKVAVNALKTGVSDYLVKSELTPSLLVRTINNVVKEEVLERKIEDQKKVIQFLAYHDYLTGALNRAAFEEMAEKAISRAARMKKKLGMLMIDLDHFKLVNDTLGHSAGDVLLQSFVKRLIPLLRKSDVLARLGGDEMGVVLDLIDKTSDAELIGKKFIDAVQKTPFDVNGQNCAITTSVGVSIFPDDGETLSILIQRADEALYKAKQLGRNQLCRYKK